MTKYDYIFKKYVVEAYQKSEGGFTTLTRRFGSPAESTIEKWVETVELAWLQRSKSKERQTNLFFSIQARCHTLLLDEQ
ncbi:hypothetical protein [Enterococcus pingfangensis]|uniref:hypothetical protein n=1 Tax=Enterococcus pingfangensis TaxID=2559924 RepID=UPI001FE9B406|nr:hypothetical protein [Enterococcus pingfangensis]